jgi:subtilisin family serine protease
VSTQALEWAITEKVDVISMSFGMDKDHPAMQAQISRAYTENIIMFAAASNRGLNYEVTFPAREERVICIYSTDGNGGKSSCNPTRLKNSGYHFATVGVAVKSAWPVKLSLPANTPSAPEPGAADAKPPKVNNSPERRMTGTSFATPIVAAIAAYILDFARMNGIGEELYQRLRCRQWMQAIFADHMVVDCDQFHYIRPWKLFADNRSDDDIIMFIKDTLTRELGGCQSAEIFQS